MEKWTRPCKYDGSIAKFTTETTTADTTVRLVALEAAFTAVFVVARKKFLIRSTLPGVIPTVCLPYELLYKSRRLSVISMVNFHFDNDSNIAAATR
jgi:hypothetical protein